MNSDDFKKSGYKAIDWIADYLEKIEQYPVKSQVNPREIFDLFEDNPPSNSGSFDKIIADLNEKILPGITHWQHPNFHAYFPANTSLPSILGELITAGLGVQGMIWETSPAATELEEKMMNWLKSSMNLPTNWHGVIQSTASEATLAAIITAREKATDYQSNKNGFTGKTLRVYCSEETHSSIEKAVKISGIGANNLVKIATNKNLSLDPLYLEQAIQEDLDHGFQPCCVVSTMGTTGTLAFDPTKEIGEICRKYELWFHVDAAYAGSALILPEYEHLSEGLELADSFVFNPHKWLLVNFDCSAYFVKDKEALIQTFAIHPEYLKSETDGLVNNFRDWGVPLGRRFRSLKLWLVFSLMGLEGVRQTLRKHLSLSTSLTDQINSHPNLELVTPPVLNMCVFRYIHPERDLSALNQINQDLLQSINASGEAYLSHYVVKEKYVIRVVIGQTNVEKRHMEKLWGLILSFIQSM